MLLACDGFGGRLMLYRNGRKAKGALGGAPFVFLGKRYGRVDEFIDQRDRRIWRAHFVLAHSSRKVRPPCKKVTTQLENHPL